MKISLHQRRFFIGLWLNVMFFVFLQFPVTAQTTKSQNNWYFGNKAGLTFATGSPQALTNGQLRSMEGCATQSDENGQLLFYSDGNTIWNRNHEVMSGATSLGGSNQSTQSVLIVPYQNSASQFYVFSVGSRNQPTGIQYAIVNTSLNGGLGGLEKKNQKMVDSSTEKITVINYCNNLNHWIITHDTGSNVFRVFLLNDNGVILPPKTYAVGSTHQQHKGYMKPSHEGRKLAVAVSDSSGGGFIELFDFDNKTGAVSNPTKLIDANTAGAYGLEFSPDDKLLYLSTMFSKKIYQFSVDGLNLTATLPVQAQSTYSPGVGALQLGPDDKLYGTQLGESSLLVINQPNQTGTGCDLVSQAISLGGKTALAGLPFRFNQLPVRPPQLTISLKKLSGCNNFLLESTVVNLDPNYLVYEWRVDGTAVVGGTQPTTKPFKSGTYSLKVREIKCQDVQLTSNEVKVVLVEVNPTARAVLDSCGAFFLNARATGGTVHWSGVGITAQRDQLDSLIVSRVNGSQTYRVHVNSPDDVTCSADKEVTVTFAPPLPFQFPTPTRTACGDTLLVRAIPTADWTQFTWRLPNGNIATGATVVAHQSGQYQVTAIDPKNGCRSEATQAVTLNPNPIIQLAAHQLDTCLINTPNYAVELNADSEPNVLYSWTKEGVILGTAQHLQASTYGTYHIIVRTADGCQTSDSVRIRSTCPPMIPVVNVPDAFTPNQDGMNESLVIRSLGTARITLTIYNRWGEPIYTATSNTASPSGWATWDGTHRGQLVMSGLYIYRLDFTGSDFPNQFTRRGVIEVIR